MTSPGPIGGDLLARRYRLIDRVGAGGMSVVWRARDEVLDRLVAVKWLGSELADDDLYRDLVRREAWATARIKHPAVAAVYDYGEVSDRNGQLLAYVVMEMLDGESLADRMRRGPISWPETIAICAQVADALATAHEHGVVHRDVSPDNVMLTSSGLRVFDFGIAAPIGEPDDDSTGSTFGTPAYVAPERLDGQPAQTATDVYSLGVMIFEMLTGRPPYPEDAWNSDAALHSRPVPRPRVPGLPGGVARLVQRCLSHDPLQRPSAREVAQRLAAYRRPWWRGWAGAGIAAAAAAVAIVLIVFAPWPEGQGTVPDALPTSPAPTPSAPATGTGAPASPTPSATASLTNTASPSIAGPSSPPPRTGPPSMPAGGEQPPVASVRVEQALDELRASIDGASRDELADHVAQDLRNYLNNLTNKLVADPNADVRSDVANLLQHIRNRAVEGDQQLISTALEAELVSEVKQLNEALGYPPLE